MNPSASIPASAIGVPLFCVIESRGSYEDAYQLNLFATHDEAAANAYVAYQNGMYASMRAKIAQSHKEAEDWSKANPQPSMPDLSKVERLALPNWNGIKVITKEMRAERNRIKAENENRVSVLWAPTQAWQQARMAIITNWQEANLTAAEVLAHQDDDYNQYEVQALSWMPPLESLLPAGSVKETQPA